MGRLPPHPFPGSRVVGKHWGTLGGFALLHVLSSRINICALCISLSGPRKQEKTVKSPQCPEACWLKVPLEGSAHGSVGGRGDDNAPSPRDAEI